MRVAVASRRWQGLGSVMAAAGAALLALATATPAQALYKVVGPNGEVTYTDRPPPDPARARQISPGGRSNGAAELPAELQRVVGRFPVTLYTAPNCRPCESGRQLLQQRGIPFSERTVTTPEDFRAYEALVSSREFPGLQIGGQRLTGFTASEWHSYLDAAGYPKASRLPPSYRHASATPLAPAPAEPEVPEAPVTASPSSAPAPQPPAGNAPPGFRF
jgi:glutaredoxin